MTELDTAALRRRLQPYLNGLQRAALAARIRAMQRMVRMASQRDRGFLLESWEWNETTAARELNGSFGVTYLKKAIAKAKECSI